MIHLNVGPAGGYENESQSHVINCRILIQMNKESTKLEYEKLFSNDIIYQEKICKQFKGNMKIMEEMKA